MIRCPLLAAVIALALHAAARAATPVGAPGVDAPALAGPGPFAVGVARLSFVQASQPDLLAYEPGAKSLPLHDRTLAVDVWYPAEDAPGAPPVTYAGALTGEDGRDVAFTATGVAVREARPRGGRFPLVVMAHGYGGTPVAMTWLAENLASKGYVIVGPHFADPPVTDGAKFAVPLARRPLDIAFVAAEAQKRARAGEGPLATADPARTVLIGYSMGGYGVLTAAGGILGPAVAGLTHGALAPYVEGGADAGALRVAGLAAVVAISPAGRFAGGQAWGEAGLAAITAPTLMIAGDEDQIVGYDPGVKTLWGEETGAPRYLLTFENAGHSIGMNPAPETMRGRLWDQDWFEDPVWRKDRVLAIELHFITAFLARYVEGDTAEGAFLDTPTVLSNQGVWPETPADRYDAMSPGRAPITVWKGFQRAHAAGLELRFAPAAR